MASYNRLSVITLLLVVIVASVDQAFASPSFIVVSSSEHHVGRHRRDVDNTTQEGTAEMKSFLIDSVIKYRYANTLVYSSILNNHTTSREIGFKAILPDAAFISGFTITTNGTVYKAYVREKDFAKKIYQEAVESGRTAGHVELSARDSNTFTVSVNVEAQSEVAFNLTYEELLTRELGTYKHKITINPGQIVKEMTVQVRIKESSNITTLIVPELRQSNELIAVDNPENSQVTKQVSGDTASVLWSPTSEEQREINAGGVEGLLEVLYDVDRVSQPNQILVNEGYFVHFFAPPIQSLLHKHVVFVLDRSGSMYGRKIEQLKEAMTSILAELKTGDTFSIVLFSDSVLVWQSDGQTPSAETRGEPLSPLAIAPATPENIESAKNTVNNIQAEGGTHIYDALQAALRLVQLGHSSPDNSLAGQAEKKPLIIFLTDGQANGPNSDSQTIISHTTRDNKNRSAVIYGLAFGKDADFGLLKKLSLKNEGFARKIYEASDASLQLKNFYREVSALLLTDVTFHYLEDQVDTGSLTKLEFKTLNNGSEIVVAGRLSNSSFYDVTSNVTGVSQTGNISLEAYPTVEVTDYYPLPHNTSNSSRTSFMERMWAYLTISQLLDLKEQMDNNQTVKERALELALRYEFVTPLTSLVVIKPNENDSRADLEETQMLPQASYSHQNHHLAMAPAMSRGVYARRVAGISTLQLPHDRSIISTADISLGARRRGRGRSRTKSTVSIGLDQVSSSNDDAVADPNPHVGSLVPLSSYTWFHEVSNDTHITVVVNGVQETLQLGYNETDTSHSACSHSLFGQSHCRHLPHCSLPNFAQDINVYLDYFCRIGNFAGVCCPDNPIS